jgi:hypothetical protein
VCHCTPHSGGTTRLESAAPIGHECGKEDPEGWNDELSPRRKGPNGRGRPMKDMPKPLVAFGPVMPGWGS